MLWATCIRASIFMASRLATGWEGGGGGAMGPTAVAMGATLAGLGAATPRGASSLSAASSWGAGSAAAPATARDSLTLSAFSICAEGAARDGL
jgi:hypothetical protein